MSLSEIRVVWAKTYADFIFVLCIAEWTCSKNKQIHSKLNIDEKTQLCLEGRQTKAFSDKS